MEYWHIGEVAEKAGISRKTLRYYEEMGLLLPNKREANGYRLYTERELNILFFILRAKRLGLPLKKVRSLVEIISSGVCACEETEHEIKLRVAEVEKQIEELSLLRDSLRQLVNKKEVSPHELIALCDGLR